jgi:hypothetical protein
MQHDAGPRRFGAAVKDGWGRLLDAARPRYRRAEQRHGPYWLRFAGAVEPAAPAPAIDPVALTTLAVNRLGPATVRTAALGRPVVVSVPDARTGEIFRTALAEMQAARPTDRLVEIVVEGSPPGARQ